MTQVNIKVNDEEQRVPAGTTISGLLDLMQITSPAVAVELNLEVQPRHQFDSCQLSEGDSVEIVTLVGGG
ncbi:MAG: sulfur carrier protein ThiS [Planctomycetota bacterium]